MTSIGWSGLARSLLLVLVAIVVSLWKQLGLERSFAWAAVRAAAQLFAIGLLLQVLLRPGVSMLWAWLWVAMMVVIASFTVRQRAPGSPRATPARPPRLRLFSSAYAWRTLRTRRVPAQRPHPDSARWTNDRELPCCDCARGRRLVEELHDKRDEPKPAWRSGNPPTLLPSPMCVGLCAPH